LRNKAWKLAPANKNTKKNTRQANIKNDELIFAGKLAGLTKQNSEQVAAQAVEGDRHGAELERDDYHDEQNGCKNGAVQEQATESQWAQAHASEREKSSPEESVERREGRGWARGVIFF
jgi:hypothetical protein